MAHKTVLIVEDSMEFWAPWARLLVQHDVAVLKAFTIHEAETLFVAHQDEIDLVIMDACVPGTKINTAGVVELMRQLGFTKPIIAASRDRHYREQLCKAGCDHQAEKDGAAHKALRLLEIDED